MPIILSLGQVYLMFLGHRSELVRTSILLIGQFNFIHKFLIWRKFQLDTFDNYLYNLPGNSSQQLTLNSGFDVPNPTWGMRRPIYIYFRLRSFFLKILYDLRT